MTVATTNDNFYVAEFERLERERHGREAWFNPVRKAALARFADRGFPTTRDEEWRFTNVAAIARTRFAVPTRGREELGLDQVRPHLLGLERASRLVFVDGRLLPALSQRVDLPEGVTLAGLRDLMGTEPDTLRPHLARHASIEASPFTALNTALFEDGAFVHVPRHVVAERPILLLYVSTGGSAPALTQPRTLVVAEDGSQVTVIESFVSLGDVPAFTNAVCELVAGDGAVIDHYRVQQESEATFHIGTTRVQQGRASNATSHAVTLGAALSRHDVHAVMAGEGGELDLNGLYLGHGRRHMDSHLRVEHAQPHCNSREFYKGILRDASHGVFTGRIVVHPGAQKTDAKQTNRNLLLSPEAQIDTRPQLEIFADDVKCTHGATIGQIEESQLFYLRARGIDEQTARNLLVYAFASESISRVKVQELREALEARLFAGASESHLLEEAVQG